jgi:hypothetical protein
VEVARQRACAAPQASRWLTALPTTPELRMTDDEFRLALGVRTHCVPLAARLPAGTPCVGGGCAFVFGAPDSRLGTADEIHLLGCRSLVVGGRCDRHGAVCQAIADAALANGGTVFMEPTNLDNFDARRGDVEVVMGMRHWIADITVAQPITPFTLRRGANSAVAEGGLGAVLGLRVNAKRRLYAAQCAHAGADFVVCGASSYGGMIPEFVALCEGVARAGTGAGVPTELRWTRKRLLDAVAVAIQRGNAAMLLHGLQAVTAGRVASRMRVLPSAAAAAAPARSRGAQWFGGPAAAARRAAEVDDDDAFGGDGAGAAPRPVGANVFARESRRGAALRAEASSLAPASAAAGTAVVAAAAAANAAPPSFAVLAARIGSHALPLSAPPVRAAVVAAAAAAAAAAALVPAGRGAGRGRGRAARGRGRGDAAAPAVRGRGRGARGARGRGGPA